MRARARNIHVAGSAAATDGGENTAPTDKRALRKPSRLNNSSPFVPREGLGSFCEIHGLIIELQDGRDTVEKAAE